MDLSPDAQEEITPLCCLCKRGGHALSKGWLLSEENDQNAPKRSGGEARFKYCSHPATPPRCTMALCLLVTAVRGQRNVHFTVAPDVYTKLRGLMPGRGVKTVWPMAPPDGPVSLGVDVYCYLGQPSNECTYDDQNDPPQWVTFCLVDPAAAVHNVRFNMLTEVGMTVPNSNTRS